jgi:hypothetical protein
MVSELDVLQENAKTSSNQEEISAWKLLLKIQKIN